MESPRGLRRSRSFQIPPNSSYSNEFISPPSPLKRSESNEKIQDELLKKTPDSAVAFGWVNKKLKPTTLYSDTSSFMDGSVIIQLLELLTGKTLLNLTAKNRSASLTFQSMYKRENISIALNFYG